MYKIIFILSLTLILVLGTPVLRAQDITPPERPVITYVTIDTSTENTIIHWSESSSPDVKWYYIYYEVMTLNGSEGVKLDSVAQGTSSYIHAGNAGNESMVYSISAIDHAGNESLRTPGFHSTIHVTLDYDSCANAIDIRWTPYTGWGENISGYRIYSRQAGRSYGQPLGTGKNDTTFRFENIQWNTQYYFFVEALKNDTLISSSAIKEKYTWMPGPPDNFNILSVDVISENEVKINFEFTDTSDINDFRLLRSLDKNADFIALESKYDLSPDENFFTDSIITGSESYFYKVGSVNSCNRVIKETNLGTNILLEGENKENENILKWNFYESWEGGVSEYQVLMYNMNGDPEMIHSVGPGVNTFSHNLNYIYGTGFDGLITYRVLAKKTGEQIYSQSNLISIELTGSMTVPNAFTPNNDGINDYFKPFFTLLPQKYMMVIYDRYGIVVYKSEDPEEGWDGRVNAGGMATEGVYVYHIQYTSHTGKTGIKTGHLTVFYP